MYCSLSLATAFDGCSASLMNSLTVSETAVPTAFSMATAAVPTSSIWLAVNRPEPATSASAWAAWR
ncbi:hypothetical protein D9M70_612280 [compost metagenome]